MIYRQIHRQVEIPKSNRALWKDFQDVQSITYY